MDKGNILKSLVVLLLFCLAGKIANGSEIHRITIRDLELTSHMDQPAIQTIKLDQDGLLWIGTQHGIYKLDGSKLRRFGSDRPNIDWIPTSDIRSIIQTKKGKILAATYGAGLLEWSEESNRFFVSPLSDLLNTKYIESFLASDYELLWVGSTSGLQIVDPMFQRQHKFAFGQELVAKIGPPTSIVQDSFGNIYISTTGGLYIHRKTPDRFSKLEVITASLGENDLIRVLAPIDKNLIAMGSVQGEVLIFDTSSDRIVAQRTISGENNSNSITALQRQGDYLWIGTDKGLAYTDINLDTLSIITQENSSLSNNSIVSLLATPELLFIGTYDGLNNLKLSRFETFNQRNSGIYNDVAAFSEDAEGKLWIGTFNGLYFFDPTTQTNKRYSASNTSIELRDERIVSLMVHRNHLWIGLYRDGIQVIDLSSGEDVTPEMFTKKAIYAIQMLSQKDGDLWIATYNHGLFQYSSEKVHQYFKVEDNSQLVITSLIELSKDLLIVGTNSGIYSLNKTTGNPKKLDFSFESDRTPLVTAMARHPSGDVWVGTKEHGFYKWSLEHQQNNTWKLEPFSDPEELSSVTVNGILFDHAENAWISTQRGVIQLDQSGTLLDRYTVANGLQGQDFNTGAAFKDAAGKLYFGGLNGFNRIDPSHPPIAQLIPTMRFTNVSLPGSRKTQDLRTDDSDEVVIEHGEYLVNFSFSVLDYLDPSQNQYRHKLENFDPDWIDDGNHNAATYTNLPTGNYILRVQGANSSGVWNREGISLEVTVLPSIWLSWWAKCLYTLAAIFIGWVFKRTYNSYVIEKRAEALAEEMHEAMQRADDDIQEQIESQEALIKSVYRHNTSTLSLAKEYVALEDGVDLCDSNSEKPSSTEAISALSVLEKCLYYQENLLCADLKKYTDLIVSELLGDAPVNPETITTINEVSSDLIQVEYASPVAVIIFELVNNCIQHAFSPVSPANYVMISFKSSTSHHSNMLTHTLEVSDNGQGLPQSLSEPPLETLGLRSVELMSQKLSATLKISTEKGTVVSVEFDAIQPF